MQDIKTSIMAKEIMDKNFPILDVSVPLIKCVRKMNNEHGACLVTKDGNFCGVLGSKDVLREFMYGKNKEAKIEKIKINGNFAIVEPELDVYETISLMKRNNIDFVLVKNKNNFLGLITKQEIADIEPILFDEIAKSL